MLVVTIIQTDICEQLMETSDPKHPNYGKHVTKEELDAQTNPSKEEIDKVFIN